MKSVSGLGASGAGLGLERKGTGTGVGGGLGPKHFMFLPMHCMFFVARNLKRCSRRRVSKAKGSDPLLRSPRPDLDLKAQDLDHVGPHETPPTPF
jgi:hypothetical protein